MKRSKWHQKIIKDYRLDNKNIQMSVCLAPLSDMLDMFVEMARRLDSKDRDEETKYARQKDPVVTLAIIEAYRREAREALANYEREVK